MNSFGHVRQGCASTAEGQDGKQDQERQEGFELYHATSSSIIAIGGPIRARAAQSRTCNVRFLTCMRPAPRSSPRRPPIPHPEHEYDCRLFHDQVILYGSDSLDAPRDFTRFIDGLFRINEAAQLDNALVSLDTDLE